MLHAFTSDYVARTHATAVRTIIELIRFVKDEDKYPDDLSLFPSDPFTDSPFLFIKDNTGLQFYSPGPDLIDDKAKIEYDPTNGIISRGDVVFPILR